MDITTLNSDFFKVLQENKDGDTNPYDLAIIFFNDNSIVFHNYLTLESEEDVTAYKELAWRYSDALFKKGRFNDAIEFILKAIPIIETGFDKFSLDKSKDIWYKGIIGIGAESAYKLRDYKTALNWYKVLYNYEPKSDALYKWIDYCRIGIRAPWIKALYICSLIIFIIGVFIHKPLSLIFLTVAIIGFVSTALTEYYDQRNLRK